MKKCCSPYIPNYMLSLALPLPVTLNWMDQYGDNEFLDVLVRNVIIFLCQSPTRDTHVLAIQCLSLNSCINEMFINYSTIDGLKHVIKTKEFGNCCNNDMRSPPTQYSKTNPRCAEVSYLVIIYTWTERHREIN